MKMTKVFERKKYNSVTAKLVGQYAGEYVDDYDLRLKQKIEAQIETAKAHFGRAIYAWTFRKRKAAREEVDKALRIVSDAFWNADETELEEIPHEFLHRIAKWKHDTVGCHLVRDGDYYLQRCSVAITHKRMGFSAGFTSIPVCTLCGKTEFECEHSRDKTYWVRGGKNKQGECSVCMEKRCAKHTKEYIYKVSPVMRLTNPVLHEVSIVRRPRFPTARLQEISIHKNDLESNTGKIDESKGMVYACHACGGACPGFDEFAEPAAIV